MTTVDAPLPSDFPVRCAYMRLYRAAQEHDAYWPREAFGSEIDTLLSLFHAEVFGGGYRLTDAGRVFWEGRLRIWDVASTNARSRTTSALVALRDGDWHDEACVPDEAQMGVNTWARFVRPTLIRTHCIERYGDRVRLTAAGREALSLIEGEAS